MPHRFEQRQYRSARPPPNAARGQGIAFQFGKTLQLPSLLRGVFAEANTSTALGRERPPAGGIEPLRVITACAPSAKDGRGWAATYLYATPKGMDAFQSPFSKESSENWNPADTRRAKPAPHLRFTNRPNWQKFDYDWLGNLSESDDNEHGFYDRSLGTQSHGNANKPYQLSAANNSSQASGSGFPGSVTTLYDAMGNLTRLSVSRTTTTATCLSDGSGCNQYYAYDWDEVGRLVRARRWDSTSAAPAASASVPTATAAIDLRYRYDASDQRVIKRTYNTNAANQRHTLYLFGSLEVHRTLYAGNAYTVDTASLVPYAMSNGVRLARLHYDAATTVPQVAGLPTELGGSNTGATLHVLLELGDHLGSTGTVLDKVSSELVEKTGYLPFGARESDYRPSRWNGFREDYGSTGKEEDVEVGLTYFGKRFLSSQLGRWVSADPLAVHAPGTANFNLYAYVSGAVLKSVDPVGLVETAPARMPGVDQPGNTASTPSTPTLQAPAKPRLEPVNNRAGTDVPSATGAQEHFDNDPGKEIRTTLIIAGAAGAATTPAGALFLLGGGSLGASDSGREDLEISGDQAEGVAAAAPLFSSLVGAFSSRGACTLRANAKSAPEARPEPPPPPLPNAGPDAARGERRLVLAASSGAAMARRVRLKYSRPETGAQS